MNRKCQLSECENLLTGNQQKWCSDVCGARGRMRLNHVKQRDKILQYKREHHTANRDKILEYKRNHYQTNRDWYNERDARRRALELGSEGTYTASDIKWLYIDQEGYCAYCNCDLDDTYHVDHVIPLSRGGSNDRGNIALACASCNLSKGTKTAKEFAA